jgi:hypothetical protein
MGKTPYPRPYVVLRMSTGDRAYTARDTRASRLVPCAISISNRQYHRRLHCSGPDFLFHFGPLKEGRSRKAKRVSYERVAESGRAKGEGAIFEPSALTTE